jgi:hypothetical protein
MTNRPFDSLGKASLAQGMQGAKEIAKEDE